VLRRIDEDTRDGALTQGLYQEFETDHKLMTAELARIWSLPAPMVAAYHYRAHPDIECDDRLGKVVTAGVTAVQNTALPEDLQISLAPWATFFGLSAGELQALAVFGEKQKERVQSLAGRLTR
jgi:hypothetical protein